MQMAGLQNFTVCCSSFSFGFCFLTGRAIGSLGPPGKKPETNHKGQQLTVFQETPSLPPRSMQSMVKGQRIAGFAVPQLDATHFGSDDIKDLMEQTRILAQSGGDGAVWQFFVLRRRRQTKQVVCLVLLFVGWLVTVSLFVYILFVLVMFFGGSSFDCVCCFGCCVFSCLPLLLELSFLFALSC